jgi:hypothetical protein
VDQIRERSGGKLLGKVKAGHPDPIIRHSIIDIEAVGPTEVITPVDSRGKDDVGNNAVSLTRYK